MHPDEQPGHLQIVSTADGSNTIYNNQVGENYHSRNGALHESRHVFLEQGLQYYLSGKDQSASLVDILEVGFGTGLNFLITAEFCTQQNINLHYCGIEAYPLSAAMISQTGYGQYVAQDTWGNFLNIYDRSLGTEMQVNPNCKLSLAACKLEDFESTELFDVVYFDAFAVAHQPEMWTEAAITHTLKFLKPGGVFVTYAITGNLKRIIKSLGLKVQKAPGAPGKREMLRAISPTNA